MRGKDLIAATLFGGAGGSSGGGSGGDGEGEKSPLDALIDGSITEVSSNVEKVKESAFSRCKEMIVADFPKARTIGASAFENCSFLAKVSMPVAEVMGENAFRYDYHLGVVIAPALTSVPKYAFSGCAELSEVDFPVATTLYSYALSSCASLKKANFVELNSIQSNALKGCYRMTALILRNDMICDLSATSALTECHHMLGTANSSYNPDGLHDGYVYVPRSLVEAYPAATNWSALTLQYRALEDYTVDGTITGELDPTKI